MNTISQYPSRQRIRRYTSHVQPELSPVIYCTYQCNRPVFQTEFYTICMALAEKGIAFDFKEVKAIPGLENGKTKTVSVAGVRVRLIMPGQVRQFVPDMNTYATYSEAVHWTSFYTPEILKSHFAAVIDHLYGWQRNVVQDFIKTGGRRFPA